MTFLVSLPALVLNSGLVANAPLASKIVTMIAAVLATIGYQTNRTSLKRAHLAVAAAGPALQRQPRTAQAGFATRGLLAFCAVFAIVLGCSLLHSTAAAGIDCVKTEGAALSNGQSIVALAGKVTAALVALAAGDVGPLEQLIVDYTEPVVACVVDDLDMAHAPAVAAGSGGSASSNAASSPPPDPVFVGAQRAIAVHQWKYARSLK